MLYIIFVRILLKKSHIFQEKMNIITYYPGMILDGFANKRKISAIRKTSRVRY